MSCKVMFPAGQIALPFKTNLNESGINRMNSKEYEIKTTVMCSISS